jgi:hypothetical protein
MLYDIPFYLRYDIARRMGDPIPDDLGQVWEEEDDVYTED